MEHNSPQISPRRRAICGRHVSLTSISILSFNFPLPPSKKPSCEGKPDFSGFSWKQPHLLAPPTPRLPAPISPRTMLHEHKHGLVSATMPKGESTASP
ncbi:hypothetical protein C8A00DRAFT_16655 [Chaetomidium leptoderma]|uniref:Uncharacterized protein n=1 Tax=Chaetomidium leptoderma TaxID=669021 RepID=A0AAN6VJJ4_9PEZI|nr:hypothetical protein C8A00DRAFT_16655 [Chaetomidium leptoderma]